MVSPLHGQFELEDVHMNIESALVDLIGELGKKYTLERSRNDLVATDIKIYLRQLLDATIDEIRELRKTIATLAIKYRVFLLAIHIYK